MRRLLTLCVLAGVAAALSTSAVLATTVGVADGKGLLQFNSAGAERNGQLIRVTIHTPETWSSSFLQGRNGQAGPIGGRNAMTVLYDVNKNGKTDYAGRLLYFQGHLRLWISGRRSNFEPLPVKRPNGKTVTFTHPVDVFFKTPGKKTVNVAITSVDRTSAGCSSGCRDRIPNHGWIRVVFPHIS